MMRKDTVIKVENARKLFTKRTILNHWEYEALRQGKEATLPAWSTLKRNKVIVIEHSEIRDMPESDDLCMVVNYYKMV